MIPICLIELRPPFDPRFLPKSVAGGRSDEQLERVPLPLVMFVFGSQVYAGTLIPFSSPRYGLEWPIPNPVFDPWRRLLYLPTGQGTVERLDVDAKILLEPFIVSGDLWGADTTPDGRFLYLTDRNIDRIQLDYVAKIDKVDRHRTGVGIHPAEVLAKRWRNVGHCDCQ